MRKEQITLHFEKNVLDKIDKLIEKGKFDNRPSLIRRAVNDFLETWVKPVYA